VELRGDRARLAAIQRLAGHGLPRLELVARQLAHARRDRADPIELQVRLDAVQRAQRQRDLAQVRVARAFAHPVDRPVHVGRACAHCGDGRRGRDPKSLCPWKCTGTSTSSTVWPTSSFDRFGRGDAERVDDDDLLRAGFDADE
jgi:hypothetical protein